MPGIADGSAEADSELETVVVDTQDPVTRWRWSCPNGHRTVEPTNGGVWCRSCARDADVDDPHHHELLDKRENETVPWGVVEWV